jgi:GT2 family glycosyltransferase
MDRAERREMDSDHKALIVSIIIPCFNRQDLIACAIESALHEGPDTEVIVVDDGSTDESWQVISTFTNIRSVRTSNRGLSAARNLGLAMAQGEFIRFLDSDDCLVEGSTVELVKATARLDRLQIAVSTVHVRADESHASKYGFADQVSEGVMPGAMLFEGVMSAWLPLFPRSLLLELGGFFEELTISEDYELASRIHARGYTFYQTAVAGYILNDHIGGRLSRQYGAKGYRRQLAAIARASANAHSHDEKIGAARTAWRLGRAAAREGVSAEANALFEFAGNLGGRAARVGSAPVLLLYRVFSPNAVEVIFEAIKRLLGR